MKNAIAALCVVCFIGIYFISLHDNHLSFEKVPKEQRLKDLRDQEILKTKDPLLGTVPRERLYKTRKKLIDNKDSYKSGASLAWEERGPNNHGGRTRAIMFDASDPTGNTIWAGGVAGGLWKCVNAFGSHEWQEISSYPGSLAIGSIAQDPVDHAVIYVSTGESWGNSFGGDGIYKTTNGGISWSRLNGISQFAYTQDLLVTDSRVFVSTNDRGIQMSNDGGITWSTSLAEGSGARSDYGGDIELASDGTLYATMGSIYGGRDGIYRSTNNGNSWTKLTIPINNGYRINISSSKSNPEILIALLEVNGDIQIIKTSDRGNTWNRLDAPSAYQMSNFGRGQGFHNISVAIDPEDEDRIYIGGIDLLLSEDGGSSWTQISQWYGGGGFQYVHADQMNMTYLPGNNKRIMFSNDGGIFLSSNADSPNPSIKNINQDYNVLQFYSCAIHPNPNRDIMLGGTQDNGSHQFVNDGINATVEVTGGDGGYCFIDQDNPNIQITSYIYNNYFITTNNWTVTRSANYNSGSFINACDYDDTADVLFTGGNSQKLMMLDIHTLEWDSLTLPALSGHRVTAVKVNPANHNEVFVGTQRGAVVKIIDPLGDPAIDILFVRPNYLSNIDIDPTDRDRILITYSNFGVQSVYLSEDGGNRFLTIDGNLPDIPVRWGIFNPSNPREIIIATELGVWATHYAEDGFSTEWYTYSDNLPLTRVDMLEVRPADGLIVAATHGRGMYTSILTDNVVDVDQDGYLSDVDCNDLNSEANPGQTEIPYNGFDDDCDPLTLDDDLDQDGFVAEYDCDDNNANINMAALEIGGNDVDENCDSSKTGLTPCLNTNRGPIQVQLDSDNCSNDLLNSGMSIRNGDAYAIGNIESDQTYYFNFCAGYNESTFAAKITVAEYNSNTQSIGNIINISEDCNIIIRHTFTSNYPDLYIIINDASDCNDTPSAIRNGLLSFGCLNNLEDNDYDGYLGDLDCDDYNPRINAGRTEIPYNDIDDDCNPLTKDDDLDGDGFALADDCDDNDPNVNPLATEITQNGIDEDCDGDDIEAIPCTEYNILNESLKDGGRCSNNPIKADQRTSSNEGYIIRRPNGNQLYYFDMCDGHIPSNFSASLSVYAYNMDRDEIGELINVSFNCRVEFYHLHTIDHPDAIVLVNRQDCENASIPSQGGYPEIGCGAYLTDQDQDGYISSEDCDDTNPNLNPGISEIPYNGLDDDCNPLTLDDDVDQDGFLVAYDCDDTNDQIYPGAFDSPSTAIDESCDGYENGSVCAYSYELGPTDLNFKSRRCFRQERPEATVRDSESFVIKNLIKNRGYYFNFCDGYFAYIFEARIVVRAYNHETGQVGDILASEVGCNINFKADSSSEFEDVLLIVTDNNFCVETSRNLVNGSPTFGCKFRLGDKQADSNETPIAHLTPENNIPQNEKIEIYPNPTQDRIYIELSTSNYKIGVYDIHGKHIKTAYNNPTMHIGELESGVYLLQIMDLDTHYITNKRIVKQ